MVGASSVSGSLWSSIPGFPFPQPIIVHLMLSLNSWIHLCSYVCMYKLDKHLWLVYI
jgi:hypothetical protein